MCGATKATPTNRPKIRHPGGTARGSAPADGRGAGCCGVQRARAYWNVSLSAVPKYGPPSNAPPHGLWLLTEFRVPIQPELTELSQGPPLAPPVTVQLILRWPAPS